MEVEDEELNNETLNVFELEKIINDKIIKNICKFKIKTVKESQGTGFLCKINFINNNPMPALITCYHLLEQFFVSRNNYLSFYHYIKDKEKIENLELNKEKRIIYKNKIFDIVIIEIKEEDNLDIFDFLNIDDSINTENPQLKNKDYKKVFILHYPKATKEPHISKGIIKDIEQKINKNAYEYEYNKFLSNYSSYGGSSGSPVFNYKNICVVGLHSEGNHTGENKGKAILIKKAIDQFIIDKTNENILYYNSPYSYLDTIDIIYYLPADNKIMLFGSKFVDRYRNICKIIHNGTEYSLGQYLPITYEDIQNKYFTIKLKGINNITDASYMFRFVNNLKDIPKISRIDTSNITNMEVMFEGCEKLEELKGIDRWNVEKVVSMKGMFYNCLELKSLPDIGNWNPKSLKSCYEMFYGCKSLPNSEPSKIEKWRNMNNNMIKEAFNGYTYGKETNKILHCLNNIDETIDFWKNQVNKIVHF